MAAKANHWHIVLFEKGTNNIVDREVASSFGSERQATDELGARQLRERWPGSGTNYGVQACADRHGHVYRDGRLQIV
jgi:hypothetical protein